MKDDEIDIIAADWTVSPRVRAFTTTRGGGISRPPFDSLNLAAHVDDDLASVENNRERVRRQYDLPSEPVWLNQVHGTNIVRAEHCTPGQVADGSFTARAGVVCAVLTADCVPLFLCSADGTNVGLFHVGWRGLVQGIVGAASRLFQPGATAWLGPSIGVDVFEIGGEVKSAIETGVQPDQTCFKPSVDGKWRADLYGLVAGELGRYGIDCSYDPALCTYADSERFFSYRRTAICGRMASLIWIQP